MNKGINPASLIAALNGDFENALVAATPGGIEAQERAGQITSNQQSTLPKEMHGCSRSDLQSLGFKFGADLDDLFVSVTFPAGWSKRGTDHAMHSDLIDAKGRIRGSIFYKAAFYDRRADMGLKSRYRINSYASCNSDGSPSEDPSATHRRTVIEDCGNEIHCTGYHARSDYDASDAELKIAKEWLDANFPQWQSNLAYWD